jgi:hypothetical protein
MDITGHLRESGLLTSFQGTLLSILLSFWQTGAARRAEILEKWDNRKENAFVGYEDVSDLCFNFAVATVAPPTCMTQRSSHLAQKQINKSKRANVLGFKPVWQRPLPVMVCVCCHDPLSDQLSLFQR